MTNLGNNHSKVQIPIPNRLDMITFKGFWREMIAELISNSGSFKHHACKRLELSSGGSVTKEATPYNQGAYHPYLDQV